MLFLKATVIFTKAQSNGSAFGALIKPGTCRECEKLGVAAVNEVNVRVWEIGKFRVKLQKFTLLRP
jgi:predicted metal-binding protein